MDKYAPTSPPAIELSEFISIPQLGLGVWQIANDKVVPTVTAALEAGYRLIDTAQGYDNEQGVGEALKSSGVERSEIFVTSKLRTKAMGLEGALAGVQDSLAALQLDYLDLMLIHWPTPAHDKYVETWKGLIEAKEQGLVKAIGVSNFTIEQLERIIGETGIVPAVDQVETHPHFQQKDLLPHLAARGIRHEAYSPLGSGEVLDDPIIGEIAASLGRSPAQVIIRWHLQRGSIVIPKSETARISTCSASPCRTEKWGGSPDWTIRQTAAPAATPRPSTTSTERCLGSRAAERLHVTQVHRRRGPATMPGRAQGTTDDHRTRAHPQ